MIFLTSVLHRDMEARAKSLPVREDCQANKIHDGVLKEEMRCYHTRNERDDVEDGG